MDSRASRRLVSTLALVAVVLAVRVLYFVPIATGPLARLHLWEESDMHFFDKWARVISEGDWLTDRALHPFLGWHRDLAAKVVQEHPEVAAGLQGSGEPGAIAERLWEDWYGGKTFHQEPLYPYLIALTYVIFGPDVRWVLAWQVAAGIATVFLVRSVARRHFGEPAGLLAGFGAALCSPLLYYEGILLRECLIACAGMALIHLVDRAIEKDAPGAWLLTGLVFGAALVLKTTVALFLAAVVCWVGWRWWSTRAPARRALLRLGALVLGAALPLAPVVARNVAVGAPTFSLSSVGPVAFLLANTADYNPEKGFVVSSEHAPRILATTGCRPLPTVVETLKTHTPGSYLSQVLGKLAGIWHWFEKPNNTSFYYYRLEAPVLAYMPVTFSIIGPLSLVGMALAMGRWREHAVLYLYVATTLAGMLLFYVLSRFRIALVPALIPFAAFAVLRFAAHLGSRRFGRAAAIAAAALLAAVFVCRPLPAWRTLTRPADYITPQRVFHDPESKAALVAGDFDAAARILERALAIQPPEVRELGPGVRARNAQEAALGRYYSAIFDRQAKALAAKGDTRGAGRAARRASELLEATGSMARP